MASEAPSFNENLINPRSRDVSLFFPFIFGLNPSNQPPETSDHESPDRIILINPFTQGMVVIERSNSENSSSSSSSNTSSLGFDHFFNDLFPTKSGQPPASKASIDAMGSVEIGENEDDQCVICLEDWEVGEKVKEMACKHRFHGECIGKWLRIHGSCPVCRYEMPAEEGGDDGDKSDGERRREIWVSFMFNSDRRTGEEEEDSSNQVTS